MKKQKRLFLWFGAERQDPELEPEQEQQMESEHKHVQKQWEELGKDWEQEHCLEQEREQ